MTSIDTWPLWIAIIVAAAPFPLSLICLMFTTYLIRYHLGDMMAALKNSRFIYLWGPSWRSRGGLWTMMLVSKIAGMVIFPKAYIRIGDADSVDIKYFPPYLKRLLIIDTTLMTITLAWVGVVAVLVKSR